jgi:hypothetical protein
MFDKSSSEPFLFPKSDAYHSTERYGEEEKAMLCSLEMGKERKIQKAFTSDTATPHIEAGP